MAYANPEDARAQEQRRVARRTDQQRLRRRCNDRARYWAKARLKWRRNATQGDYLRAYAEEYARAEKELGL